MIHDSCLMLTWFIWINLTSGSRVDIWNLWSEKASKRAGEFYSKWCTLTRLTALYVKKIFTLVHKSEIHMYTCLCCWGGPGILDCVEYGCNLATVLMVDEEADSCSWIYQPKSGRDTTRKNICCLWIILDSSLCFSIFHTSSNIKYVCWGQTKFEYPYKNKMFHKLSLIRAFIFIEPRFSTPKKRWICKYLKIFCGPISNTSRFHFHTW